MSASYRMTKSSDFDVEADGSTKIPSFCLASFECFDDAKTLFMLLNYSLGIFFRTFIVKVSYLY